MKVRVEGVPTQCLLTVDGQIGFELHVDDEVICQRSAYTVNLVRISESGFFAPIWLRPRTDTKEGFVPTP